MSSRLAAAFERASTAGRPALITYVVPGHPAPEETPALLDAMIAGGADIVEIGVPFSDPLADGTTVQRVSFEALAQGTTLAKCIDFVREARARHPSTPFVFMSYLNPVLAYGLERFAADAGSAGADGVILVDLPPEEADAAKSALNAHELDLIFLVAPTSSDERLQIVADHAGGFIYCVSVAGVTGARDELPSGLADFVARVRRCTPLPLAVGFGISRREHIESLAGVADGVVVASALLNLINAREAEQRAGAVREFVETLTGHRSASEARQA
ncbi:MAG TPA: tryptophan synthase subunit alpha [Dehalococcoidia bacterium]|nr:tryptophan synthase subunit alpha [Dehalococcoidia bacterium]